MVIPEDCECRTDDYPDFVRDPRKAAELQISGDSDNSEFWQVTTAQLRILNWTASILVCFSDAVHRRVDWNAAFLIVNVVRQVV
jgi:hypothetical protein